MAFLAREAATKDYRLDGVHLAICLHHYGVLDTSAADAGEGLVLASAGFKASWRVCRGVRTGTGRPWPAPDVSASTLCTPAVLCSALIACIASLPPFPPC